MPQRTLFRSFARHAGRGRRVFWLAIAVPIEPQLPAPNPLFSPGLNSRVRHAENPQIYGVDLGWFLRMHRREPAFYFAISPDCVPCESPALQIIRAFSGSLEIDEVLVMIGGEHSGECAPAYHFCCRASLFYHQNSSISSEPLKARIIWSAGDCKVRNQGEDREVKAAFAAMHAQEPTEVTHRFGVSA